MNTDPYDRIMARLSSDTRSLNELSRLSGIPAETLRDVRNRLHRRSPRLDTLRAIAKLYPARKR